MYNQTREKQKEKREFKQNENERKENDETKQNKIIYSLTLTQPKK